MNEMAAVRWRLGRRDELDGLRAIAVLLVVMCHIGIPNAVAAGGVGVTVFFTISGFLITALLLAEHDASGRVNLVAFYRRRALRLFPALFVMLGVIGTAMIVLKGHTLGWFVREAVPAMLYYGNWPRANGDFLGAWSHTWSLAIEEQFYLVWPVLIIFAARWGWRAVAVLAGAGAVASIVTKFLLWNGGDGLDRVYFGSDTRADSILVGCCLAAILHQSRDGASRSTIVPPLLGVAVLLGFTGDGLWGLVVTPTVIPFLTAGLLFCVARGTGVAWLRWAPLTLVGRRSYALYLWHYPIIGLGQNQLPGPRALVMTVLVGISWVATLLSWKYVEEPFLRRKDRRPAVSRPPLTRSHAAAGDGQNDH